MFLNVCILNVYQNIWKDTLSIIKRWRVGGRESEREGKRETFIFISIILCCKCGMYICMYVFDTEHALL